MPRTLLALIAFICGGPTAAFAWGDLGHQIVGIIAYSRLTATAKKNVDALLAADKDELTATDFVSRNTWADKYRDSDRRTTKLRYEATRNWHFVDVELATGDIDAACADHPKLPRGTAASAGPANSCVIDKIEQFSAELRDRLVPKTEKIVALKFLLHFIGDLHQPLHASDNNDRGGNEVPVLFGPGHTLTNLHFYWDNYVVESLGSDSRATGALLSKQIGNSSAGRWSTGTTIAWARESFKQAKSVAYNFTGLAQFTDDRGAIGVRLDSSYENVAAVAAREQLMKAGVRLATLLNNIMR